MSTVVEAAIGRDVRRNDGKNKVSGATRYAGDLIPKGALHVALVTSPHARAEITGIDLTAALALSGVVTIVTAADLLAAFPDGKGEFLLAEGYVSYAGQPVAAVLAESEAIAGDAANLVTIEYTPLAAITDPLVAMVA